MQRSVTDEIMYELMRLSGQEYVDVYASTVKERQAARKGGSTEAALVDLPVANSPLREDEAVAQPEAVEPAADSEAADGDPPAV